MWDINRFIFSSSKLIGQWRSRPKSSRRVRAGKLEAQNAIGRLMNIDCKLERCVNLKVRKPWVGKVRKPWIIRYTSLSYFFGFFIWVLYSALPCARGFRLLGNFGDWAWYQYSLPCVCQKKTCRLQYHKRNVCIPMGTLVKSWRGPAQAFYVFRVTQLQFIGALSIHFWSFKNPPFFSGLISDYKFLPVKPNQIKPKVLGLWNSNSWKIIISRHNQNYY